MLTSGRFWIGVAVGALVPIAYHRWVKPMPTSAG